MSELFDFLQKAETKEFIQENINTDLNKLLLNPPAQVTPFSKHVVAQIQSRQKAKKKLPLWASNFNLILPPPLSIEQASSAKTSDYKKSILKGCHLFDLTGGMGVDTLALSQNFKHTTYVEQQKELSQIFKHNCAVLGKKIEVVSEQAEVFLQNFKDDHPVSFFIDPARRDGAKNRVFNLEDCTPNLVELLPLLKEKGSHVLIKLSPFLDIKIILEKIGHVKEIHVVSVKNDCKELLVYVDFSFDDEPLIMTVNIEQKEQAYNFKFSEERESQSKFKKVKKYILEPNSSILKAGAFNKIGVDFNIAKLHQNSHLYTSDHLIVDWPGRTFEVLEKDINNKTLDKYSSNGHINVITRNYPASPANLKKKFKVSDGGDFFMIGFLDTDQKNNLVVARKTHAGNV